MVDVLKDVFVLMDKFYQITHVLMEVHVQVSATIKRHNDSLLATS